jgi:hypothetical protein
MSGITLILTSRISYYCIVVVSKCFLFNVSCVITSGTSYVSIVAAFGTGRSFRIVRLLIVTESCNYAVLYGRFVLCLCVRIDLTARAGVILCATVCYTGSSYCIGLCKRLCAYVLGLFVGSFVSLALICTGGLATLCIKTFTALGAYALTSVRAREELTACKCKGKYQGKYG